MDHRCPLYMEYASVAGKKSPVPPVILVSSCSRYPSWANSDVHETSVRTISGAPVPALAALANLLWMLPKSTYCALTCMPGWLVLNASTSFRVAGAWVVPSEYQKVNGILLLDVALPLLHAVARMPASMAT